MFWDVLVTAEQCLHSVKAFSAPHTAHQQGGWGCTSSWDRTQLGELTPADQRDSPHHITSRSAIKTGWKFARAAIAWVQAGHRCVGGEQLFLLHHLFFLGLVWFFPPLGCFFFSLSFFKIIKPSVSQPMSFLTFTLPILSPIPLVGRG